MTPLKLLPSYTCLAMMMVGVAAAIIIHFDHAPPARSRLTSAVFQYSVEGPHKSNACKNNQCSIYCKIDGHTLGRCPSHRTVLKNLTANSRHTFLVNVATPEGERNSSSYSWFIDTLPPIAAISSKQNYTAAEKITVHVAFSEACTGLGGFKCVNSSSCDVIVNGPASILASSLRTIDPGIRYSLNIILHSSIIYSRVVITMADKFCTDGAGNHFRRTSSSTLIVHIDRRPVRVDLWASIPAYLLGINGVPRTVYATNKMEDVEIFLEFSTPIVNSLDEIQKALLVNPIRYSPIPVRSHGNRRYNFKLMNISSTEIITIKLEANKLIGRTGFHVSPVAPLTFLYDSSPPGVWLSTSSPVTTRESNVNIIVEFTKPVFGFKASVVEVKGGTLTRQVHTVILKTTFMIEEISRALYSLTIHIVSQNVVSVVVPAGKVNDVSGNVNVASNRVEVKPYSAPAISTALHCFMTVGVLATSLAAALLTTSSANLGAIETLSSGTAYFVVSDPSLNLYGMIGHLQVFVLSDWFSPTLPVEYSETTRGLRWLVPHGKLPWKKRSKFMWPNNNYLSEEEPSGPQVGSLSIHPMQLNSMSYAYLQQGPLLPSENYSYNSDLHGLHNVNGETYIPDGKPMDSGEYFTYFLRGEPLSADNVANRMKHYTGWQDLEMNLFWLGIGGGSLLVFHLLILLFLRWRFGRTVHGLLSVPRFELFLLLLVLPCLCQSSAFAIGGKTTAGIIVGALLLAIPTAFIITVCLFLVVTIFTGSFIQYKEVKYARSKEPWFRKLWVFFTGRPTIGKWSCSEGPPASFLLRFGILFEGHRGPPLFIFADPDDPTGIPKSFEAGQSGSGRPRALSSDGSTEETRSTISERLLGCARTSYVIIDLLRRVTLGIVSGASSTKESSQGLVAFTVTIVQFLYLCVLKPYISRGVHLVECLSLLSEAVIFGLSICLHGADPTEEKTLGYMMLALLFITYVTQSMNQWHAMIRYILRFGQSQEESLKLGLKCAAKCLILPLLPRKHWSRLIPKYPQPDTVTDSSTRAPHVDPLSAMTATVVPVLNPNSPGYAYQIGSTSAETNPGRQRSGDSRRLKGLSERASDLKKLREMARATFSGQSKPEEGSTSYGLRPQQSSLCQASS
ncbi:hypothetical protein RJ641_007118 [Dillenia turbinata]|uniref:Bacterial Ig-like domain-containing protein n=1 Tax=Dillenia turbinata TaxID=194707 RepID=A0AAN8VJK1_9MAGN